MARKTEKLLIPKFDPSASSQQDIASRLIEYAYEHAEVVEAKEDDLE